MKRIGSLLIFALVIGLSAAARSLSPIRVPPLRKRPKRNEPVVKTAVAAKPAAVTTPSAAASVAVDLRQNETEGLGADVG